MKVYIISTLLVDKSENIDFQNITDEQFMDLSSKYGTSYSLRGFENTCNQDDFDHVNTFIRFIE
jgi:hypothetical protein